MDITQSLVKNKPRTILLALSGIEIVALIILGFVVFGASTDLGMQSAAAVPANPPRRATVNLQFLDPAPKEHYRLAGNNPFKGIERPPVVVQRPPTVPRVSDPPKPPQPKQIIVVYRGLIFFANGSRAALVEDRHKSEQRFLQQDESLYNYKIIDFDADNLILEKGDGQFIIPRSQPTSVGEVR